MENFDIYLNLVFDAKTDTFEVDTNLKKEKVVSVLTSFLRSQIGKGTDQTALKIQDKYEIKLALDLSEDKAHCTHNCGNKGLREGLILHYLDRITDEKEVSNNVVIS